MKAKQLESFSENDFEIQKTYFRKVDHWIIIDNINRDNFTATRNIHYKMIVNMAVRIPYNDKNEETKPLMGDINAKKISIEEYFKLSDILKNGTYSYNKKLGKCILK
jgi:hypothetical protein